jgi:hypothetical protein
VWDVWLQTSPRFDERGGRYARAYLDFFEDEVVRSNYDWKVVQRYVVEGDEPLLSGMISGGTLLIPPLQC